MKNIRCERCGKPINPAAARWLELSRTDGNYHIELPFAHRSQGSFSFGAACAVSQLEDTASNRVRG